jgi:hypothetical protein
MRRCNLLFLCKKLLKSVPFEADPISTSLMSQVKSITVIPGLTDRNFQNPSVISTGHDV